MVNEQLGKLEVIEEVLVAVQLARMRVHTFAQVQIAEKEVVVGGTHGGKGGIGVLVYSFIGV